jgi:outer membrane biosynthesis protein TonB
MVVTRVLAARRVPKATPWGAEWSPQELAQRRLQLQGADLPTYPYIARLAGLEGEVEVEVTLKDGKVAATRVIAGDRALATATVANIETWTFDANVSETFTTRFVYALERRFGPMHSQKFEVKLDLPSSVRITAPRNGW